MEDSNNINSNKSLSKEDVPNKSLSKDDSPNKSSPAIDQSNNNKKDSKNP